VCHHPFRCATEHAPNARENQPGTVLQNYLPDVWKRDLMDEQQAKLSAHHAALARAVIR
jgi:hypothetical protein